MNKLQKAAEILVESGYADKCWYNPSAGTWYVYVPSEKRDKRDIRVNPFADTLDGWKQADTIKNCSYDS